MKKIVMYGGPGCSDCNRTKKYLEAFNIQYQYIDITIVSDATEKVMEMNKGKKVIPTLLIAREVYSNPSYLELNRILGFKRAF